MLGSSSTYNVPTREEPRDVARFILCVSPPDNVLLNLSRVKYPIPTLFKNVQPLYYLF